MASKWPNDGTFHLGINMAGAVSAGAYTAGVLDFLMEALEQWYAAKAAPNPELPAHGVSIDVFSGASAGGMCAAISSVMVQSDFQHIKNPADVSVKDTTNKFYESWVNKIDIEYLLDVTDVQDGGPVVSFLDSNIIDEIADYAINPGQPAPRPYISPSLNLFLTLTNIRGVPFSLNGAAAGSAEEEIAYFADRLQFETVTGNNAPLASAAKPLPLGSSGGAWPLLKEAAKATGAFPLFLAPRTIDRVAGDYCNAPWEPISTDVPSLVDPHWPLKPGETFTTLNVDGGVTNNDPFQLAHDFMAIHNPMAAIDAETGELANPRAANEANCAVLTVAPFPSYAAFDSGFDAGKQSSVFRMLPNLFGALVSQSRFQGESLMAVMSGASYSRFVLAPSDADNPKEPALQCGLLSAFGGFFERGFRAHDYQLGRRNCQKLLRDHFRLAIDNPVIAAGLKNYDAATRNAILRKYDPEGKGQLPIIPLCGTAVDEVPAAPRATITSTRVGHILNWAVDRMHAITKPLVESTVGTGFEGWAARSAVDTLISTWGKAKLKDTLQTQLGSLIVD